ncbi:serine hydrolase domain-containing protein [Nonomuraea endophytica]|uniref:CubicO group peptidase (Beta-lactamase class C family) n=1 Tax=Nonomuraea endophytica TaxID=714136 RepID=A0A7W7ZYE6_9ACTN|nr:serine hydrolase domain-containing protein [Nonomuraea endophytica]MBB5076117.1 CubicO group peptidase (beta-lactamase class C family) [Nonomuraea endophytica]
MTELAERVDQVIRDGGAPGLHGLVVIRGGQTVLERYGQGEDFKWNDSIGTVVFDRDTLHDIRSVTKSITALVYGIALGKGLVPDPDEPLMAAFPEYPDLAESKRNLTVAHALTMTLGLEWDESVPYTSPANSEIAMEMAPDRYRYVLERPVVEEPGTRWDYCGGASALIGRLIVKGVGTTLDAFARDTLFDPLGISFEWMAGDDGAVSAASGLRLAPRDLAAVGQLVLEGGRGIVPGEWITRSLTRHVAREDGSGYGYQWYLGDGWFAGFGNGGQRLFVVPGEELVVATAAGEYNDFGQPSASAVMDAVLSG